MAKWAGLKTARKQRHSWGDIEAVMKAISEYMETSGQDGKFPTQMELYSAGRHDLRYALQVWRRISDTPVDSHIVPSEIYGFG